MTTDQKKLMITLYVMIKKYHCAWSTVDYFVHDETIDLLDFSVLVFCFFVIDKCVPQLCIFFRFSMLPVKLVLVHNI